MYANPPRPLRNLTLPVAILTLTPYDTLPPRTRNPHRLPAPDHTHRSHCAFFTFTGLTQPPRAAQSSVYSHAGHGALSTHTNPASRDTTTSWPLSLGRAA